MNSINKPVSVGNPDQNADCVVHLFPGKGNVEIKIDSLVYNQFGKSIKETILDELKKHKVDDVIVHVVDRGAIDPVLRARVECAIKRGLGDE